jgi:hypothetical protein
MATATTEPKKERVSGCGGKFCVPAFKIHIISKFKFYRHGRREEIAGTATPPYYHE